MRKTIIWEGLLLLALASSAHAHMGACTPAEVGRKVTLCDLGNRTQCIANQNVPKKTGWLLGRCRGQPAPCKPGECGPDYTVCCKYANGSVITAASEKDCPATDPSGSCFTTFADAARADPLSRGCIPDDDENFSPQFAATGPRLRTEIEDTSECTVCDMVPSILKVRHSETVVADTDGSFTIVDFLYDPLTSSGEYVVSGKLNNLAVGQHVSLAAGMTIDLPIPMNPCPTSCKSMSITGSLTTEIVQGGYVTAGSFTQYTNGHFVAGGSLVPDNGSSTRYITHYMGDACTTGQKFRLPIYFAGNSAGASFTVRFPFTVEVQ